MKSIIIIFYITVMAFLPLAIASIDISKHLVDQIQSSVNLSYLSQQISQDVKLGDSVNALTTKIEAYQELYQFDSLTPLFEQQQQQQADFSLVAKKVDTCFVAFQHSNSLDDLLSHFINESTMLALQQQHEVDTVDTTLDESLIQVNDCQAFAPSVASSISNLPTSTAFEILFSNNQRLHECLSSCDNDQNCNLVITGNGPEASTYAVLMSLFFPTAKVMTFGAPPVLHAPCFQINPNNHYRFIHAQTKDNNQVLHYDNIPMTYSHSELRHYGHTFLLTTFTTATTATTSRGTAYHDRNSDRVSTTSSGTRGSIRGNIPATNTAGDGTVTKIVYLGINDNAVRENQDSTYKPTKDDTVSLFSIDQYQSSISKIFGQISYYETRYKIASIANGLDIGDSCGYSDECQSHNICGETRKCLARETLTENGEYCSSNEQCQSQRCNLRQQRCIPQEQIGSFCYFDSDCELEAKCIASTCTIPTIDSPCDSSSQCQYALSKFESFTCIDGSCQGGEIGNQCKASFQCKSGYCAGNTNGDNDVESTCHPKLSIESECISNGDCSSNRCALGLCQSGDIGSTCETVLDCNDYYSTLSSSTASSSSLTLSAMVSNVYCAHNQCSVGSRLSPCENSKQCQSKLHCAMDECHDGSIGSPCVDDKECDDEICSVNFGCTDGNIGNPCDDTEQCLNGLQCQNNACIISRGINNDEPNEASGRTCQSGEECEYGICDGGECTTGSNGDLCEVDDNCISSRCDDSTCQAKLKDGQRCDEPSDCASGLCVYYECQTGTAGSRCEWSDDCNEGYLCADNQCTDGGAGSYCKFDAHCTRENSNVCVNNACVYICCGVYNENAIPVPDSYESGQGRPIVDAVMDHSAGVREFEYGSPMNCWDVSKVTNFDDVFNGYTGFNEPLNCWDTSNAKLMDYMFYEAESFNQDISSWDLSSVTSALAMFFFANSFNQDLPNWDLSSAEDLGYMLAEAHIFNGDLSNWIINPGASLGYFLSGSELYNRDLSKFDVSQAGEIVGFFDSAGSFNSDISSWNVSLITSFRSLFEGATSFNVDISGWETGNAESMASMFYGASSFNIDISNWNTNKVTTMSQTFQEANSFNRDLTNWKTSNVESLDRTFAFNTQFNGNLENWDTSKVTTFASAFRGSAFDRDISRWETSSATSMSLMFQTATKFNQDISGWNINSCRLISNMFEGASSFSQNLCAWVDSDSSLVATTSAFVNSNCPVQEPDPVVGSGPYCYSCESGPQ